MFARRAATGSWNVSGLSVESLASLGTTIMTSGRQRKARLKERRRPNAHRAEPKARGPGLPDPPSGAVMADLAQLEHDNTYGPRPLFYIHRRFACIDCGSKEVWTAADQKWWYEVAKGSLRAVPCAAQSAASRIGQRSMQRGRFTLTDSSPSTGLRRQRCAFSAVSRKCSAWLRQGAKCDGAHTPAARGHGRVEQLAALAPQEVRQLIDGRVQGK